jgi:hypothetical protein
MDRYWRTVLTVALIVALALAGTATYYLVRYPVVDVTPGRHPVVIDRLDGSLHAGPQSTPATNN